MNQSKAEMYKLQLKLLFKTLLHQCQKRNETRSVRVGKHGEPNSRVHVHSPVKYFFLFFQPKRHTSATAGSA